MSTRARGDNADRVTYLVESAVIEGNCLIDVEKPQRHVDHLTRVRSIGVVVLDIVRLRDTEPVRQIISSTVDILGFELLPEQRKVE